MSPDRRIETIRDVPAAELDRVTQDFKDSGASEVTKTKQPNGKFTVEARFEAGAQYPASGEYAL
jgi:hypothetical protein